jgi:PAS domain S-box-containing protein
MRLHPVLLVFLAVFYPIFTWISPCHLLALESPPKKVLFLSSYHPGFPTFFQQVEGIKSAFEGKSILLDIEFMDSKRFPDTENLDSFYRALSTKLSRLEPYDIIVTGDDNALSFVIERQKELFFHLPVVFLGVNNLAKAMEQNNNPFITGVIEAVSMKETLELITRLHPETKRIIALVDATPSGQGDLKTFYNFKETFAPIELSDITLANLSFDEFRAQLKTLGDEDIALLLSAYRDKSNKTLLFHESLQLIKASLSRPLYHLWLHGMDDGVLGGKVVSHYQQGKAAANIVLEILGGRQAGDITVTNKSPNAYVFDYKEMELFNLKVSDLPQGSIIYNQPRSYYQEHKKLIWTCLGIILGYSLLVCFMWINVRRRKSAQEALRESEERFRLLLNSTAEAIYGVDTKGDCVFCNPACLTQLGYDHEADLLGKNMHNLMHHHRKDGSEYPEEECLVYQAFRKGEGVHVDDEVLWRADGTSFDAEYTSYPMRKQRELIGSVVAFHDISERRKSEAALMDAKKAAEEANQVKSEFLAKISHEIRTPMTVFISAVEHLIDIDKDTEHQKILELAELSSQRLYTLVEEVLDFSKIEDQKMELYEEKFELRVCLNDTLRLMHNEAKRKGLHLTSVVSQNIPASVVGDEYRVGQILLNLIGNAIKFTETGWVKVSVDLDNGNLVFKVSDSGMGIPAEKQKSIFEVFKQADNSITRKHGGAGLGLAISKGLIELMGGRITVQSQPGEGSTFTFSLLMKS